MIPARGEAPSALRGGLPAALLATMLVALNVIVDPAAYDVSQLPRLLALSAVLVVAVPVVLLVPSIARRLDPAPLGDPVVAASAAYLAACVLSLAVAINPSAGLTDVFRTLTAFLVLCLCLLVLPLDPRWRQRLLEMAVVATLVAAAVASWRVLPAVAAGWPTRRAMEEAMLSGMMSNVNLFAGYLLLLLPWCCCGVAALTGGWRIAAAVAAAAGFALVVVLQSRAAWLGLGAGGLACGLAWLRRQAAAGGSRAVRSAVIGTLLTGVAGVAIVGGVALTDTPPGRAIRRLVVERPHQAARPSDGGRTMIWDLTTRMIADRPLLGVGAGNFTIHLHEYFGPDKLAEAPDFSALSSDNWLQPHNDFLWVAAEKGVPGIIAFVAVFFLALKAVRGVLRDAASPLDAELALAALGAIVAHLVFSCFDFPLDRVSHQTVLAVHLAAVVLLARGDRTPAAPPLVGWLVVPLVGASLVPAILYAAKALGQEREVMAARRAAHVGDWTAMREAARRADTPWKTLDPFAVPVAFLEGIAARNQGDLPAATTCFERAYLANPNRLYVLLNLGSAYAESGRFDEAIAAFVIAANRYPDRIEVRHNLACALIDAERFDEAVAVIEAVPEAARTELMRELLEAARADPAPAPDP